MRGTVLALVMVLVPSGAIAQGTTHSLASLNRQGVIEAGERILITADIFGDGEYEESTVEFVGLTDSAIIIKIEVHSLPQGRLENITQADGGWQAEIPEDRVRQIVRESGPPAGLGGVLGAVGGGAAGALAGASSSRANDSGGAPVLFGALAGAAAGGVVLWLVFRSMGNEETLYTSNPSALGALDISLTPVVSKGRQGALLTLTW